MRRHFFSHASIIIQFSRHRAEISPLSTRERLMEHDKTYTFWTHGKLGFTKVLVKVWI